MSDLPALKKLNRYQQIMERIFFWHYQEGASEIVFERADMERAAQELGLSKNSLCVQTNFPRLSVAQLRRR